MHLERLLRETAAVTAGGSQALCDLDSVLGRALKPVCQVELPRVYCSRATTLGAVVRVRLAQPGQACFADFAFLKQLTAQALALRLQDLTRSVQ
jgi:hypothetical protein